MASRHFSNSMTPCQFDAALLRRTAFDTIASLAPIYDSSDPSVYTGTAGLAYLLLRASSVCSSEQQRKSLLNDAASRLSIAKRESSSSRFVPSFMLGKPGILALSAWCARLRGDDPAYHDNVDELETCAALILQSPPASFPCEVLYGLSGFLCAVAFMQRHVSTPSSPVLAAHALRIVHRILEVGRSYRHPHAPLFFEWHGKPYLGAAHGVAGILHTLLHFPLTDAEKFEVAATLQYLMSCGRFPSGNYRSSDGTDGGESKDRLVQWCHGAPGFAIVFAHAFIVLGDVRFLHAARAAADVVWERGLVRKLSLCHGVAGNLYAFLALRKAEQHAWRLRHMPALAAVADASAGDDALLRAAQFAMFLVAPANHPTAEVKPLAGGGHAAAGFSPAWRALVQSGEMHGGDHSASLFEGEAGVALALIDVLHPESFEFPGFPM